jgi:hypothetical protein
VHSPEVWEHPQAHPHGCPSLKRTHMVTHLSYNKHHLDNIMTQALGENDNFLGMFTMVNIGDYTKLEFNFYVVKWGNIDFEKLLI